MQMILDAKTWKRNFGFSDFTDSHIDQVTFPNQSNKIICFSSLLIFWFMGPSLMEDLESTHCGECAHLCSGRPIVDRSDDIRVFYNSDILYISLNLTSI